MSTLFLPETPKEKERDDLKLINTFSKGTNEKNLSLFEETDLLIKIQNSKSENYEEHLDYLGSDDRLLVNDCLNRTPVKKRYNKEYSFTQSNKLLTTPKKYFGEDILNTVPKNMVMFTNYVDKSLSNKRCNTKLNNTWQKSKFRRSLIRMKSACNKQCKFCNPEFSCTNISIKSVKKNLEEWFIYLFNALYDFIIYQLPLALIFYSFAIYLLSCL